MLKVTRRTREVDIILNQQIAEDIARLGDTLSEETTREQITEAGTNRQAKATAKRIEQLREQADAETLKLTLRALPVSKWAQALAAHRNENGTNDMFGTAAAALPLMLDSATIGGKQNPVMRLLAVLEIFGLASYEVRGGQNLEIFVRVNDPQKIRSLSEDRRYKNQQLAEIHRRHADAEEMMTAFLTSDLTTKQRWDLIEDYFLGHDEVVAQVLGLNEEN